MYRPSCGVGMPNTVKRKMLGSFEIARPTEEMSRTSEGHAKTRTIIASTWRFVNQRLIAQSSFSLSLFLGIVEGKI